MDVSGLRLYDNTRISDFRRCPRFFFFRHVMGWKRKGAFEDALAFGGGWHAAMDVLWRGIADGKSRSEVISEAFVAFCKYWIEAGMPHPDEIDMEVARQLGARTPMNARDKLEGYWDSRFSTIRDLEILEIERAFAVPLDPNDQTLFYIGRIDKIVKPSKSRIRGIEHKTTTSVRLNTAKDHVINGNYLESFSPNSQVDGYSYALHLLFPDLRQDVWVDATLVHKVGEDFQFIPVERQMQQLDAFLFDTHWWTGKIEEEKAALQEVDSGDRIMAAFPKNTSSCFDFNRPCPYIDICKSRANPTSWNETPPGYKEEFWDPLVHLGTPKEIAE